MHPRLLVLLVGGEIWKFGGISFLLTSWWQPRWILLIPVGMYLNLLAAAAAFGAMSSKREGRIRLFLTLIVAFPVMHLSYGLGMYVGRFTRARVVGTQTTELLLAKRLNAVHETPRRSR